MNQFKNEKGSLDNLEGSVPVQPDRRGLLLGTFTVGVGAAAGVAALGAGAAHAANGQPPTSQQPPGSTAPTEAGSQPAGTPALGYKLNGKLAVVTGAARGIGRSIAVEFAANGADVVGLDICGPASADTLYPYSTRADLDETERLVTSHGRRFMPVVADIRDIAALRAAAASVASQMGQVHIVAADAGIQLFKPLLDMSDTQWHDVINVNLNGTANTLRAFGPALVMGGGGRIIVLASMQGRYGTKNGSSYSASKWGIIGLMKSAALELGQHKITVNAVVPGLIDTPMTRNEMRWKLAIAADIGRHVDHPTEAEAVAALKTHSPLGVPWLKPDQVAPTAVFLASDAAAMVTGATYEVTGGDSAHDTA